MPVAQRSGDAFALLLADRDRARVVRAFVLNPERSWSAPELGGAVQVAAPVARRILRALVHAGFAKEVRRRGRGQPSSVFVPGDPTAFTALQEFILSVGLPDLAGWARRLARLGGKVRLVVAAGVLAGDKTRLHSEAAPELLIVMDKPDPAQVRRAVVRLEREIGRELVVALFSREEFAYRRHVLDRAVREVFEQPHRIVRGSPEVL